MTMEYSTVTIAPFPRLLLDATYEESPSPSTIITPIPVETGEPRVNQATGCAGLDSLSDFSRYVDLLNARTGFKTARLENCKAVICEAVYGTGSPDISGIGVTVGYVVATGLSFFLAALLFFQIRREKRRYRREHGTAKSLPNGAISLTGRFSMTLISGNRTFFDSAAYFAIALQIATIVLTSKKDNGIGTDDFGAVEAQIAHAASIVSLLPLLSPIILLDSGTILGSRDPRSSSRLFLFTLAVALSFYPFVSRCIHSFGVSSIRDGEGGDVSLINWSGIENLCFSDGLDSLRSNRLYKALNPLELAASSVVYLMTLWQQFGLLAVHHDTRHPRASADFLPLRRQTIGDKILTGRLRLAHWLGYRSAVGWVLLPVPLGLAGPLLWTIFHLRGLQETLANFTIPGAGGIEISSNSGSRGGGGYAGNDWGFGQIVAVVLFMPVGVSMFYTYWFGTEASEGR